VVTLSSENGRSAGVVRMGGPVFGRLKNSRGRCRLENAGGLESLAEVSGLDSLKISARISAAGAGDVALPFGRTIDRTRCCQPLQIVKYVSGLPKSSESSFVVCERFYGWNWKNLSFHGCGKISGIMLSGKGLVVRADVCSAAGL